MQEIQEKRKIYIDSCDQLLTISCILAGFAFSGLIALPSINQEMFMKIVNYLCGDFETTFYFSYYFLFLSTLCFLCAILTILVYKAGNYFIPIKKLRRVYVISSLLFSLAIASLLISVIAFGVPTKLGRGIALLAGGGVAACFIWENMVPWQKNKRKRQLESEQG